MKLSVFVAISPGLVLEIKDFLSPQYLVFLIFLLWCVAYTVNYLINFLRKIEFNFVGPNPVKMIVSVRNYSVLFLSINNLR